MALARSRLTAQGQVSVPAEVRRRLGVEPGAILEWDDEEGKIVLRRAGRHSSEEIHRAVFPSGVIKARTIDDLKAGVRRYVEARHARR